MTKKEALKKGGLLVKRMKTKGWKVKLLNLGEYGFDFMIIKNNISIFNNGYGDYKANFIEGEFFEYGRFQNDPNKAFELFLADKKRKFKKLKTLLKDWGKN